MWPAPTTLLITPETYERALAGKPLTEAQRDAVAYWSGQIQADLESLCNRPFGARTITEDVRLEGGRLFLAGSPVGTVTSVQLIADDGTTTDAASSFGAIVGSWLSQGDSVLWGIDPDDTPTYRVSYTTIANASRDSAAAGLIMARLGRMMARVLDDALGVSSAGQGDYSASYIDEGWTPEEVARAMRLSKPVVRR